MAWQKKLVLLLLIGGTALGAETEATAPASIDFNGKWMISTAPGKRRPVSPDRGDQLSVTLDLPGSFQVWQENDRRSLRPDRETFRRRFLSMDVMAEGEEAGNVRGVFFVKDKDGYWFQSPECFYLSPGQWQRISVDLTSAAAELVPVGHSAAWSPLFAAGINAAGLSLFDDAKAKVKLHCRPPVYHGERSTLPLGINNWRLAESCERYQMIESRFDLSREYFNPFDPEEIKVDVEAVAPDGSKSIWPAFYSQDYTRRMFANREQVRPQGRPFWAFRFTPRQSGEYRIRIRVTDNSQREETGLSSPWRTVKVVPSRRTGFVRVSRLDPRYFELETGEFYYPIGMNIHTNIDLRSESAFKFGHIPDHGTFDYEMYFEQMAKNRMNIAEIWMASWTYAIEWSSSCQNFYGLGRYSLASGWRLDHVLKSAREKGIYVHLTLDNHGKMSSHSDQEWDENPYNIKHPFAVANGAFLKEPKDYFSSEEAFRLDQARNRYIAGRWGPFTNIMGIELWSEGNLVTEFDTIYNNDTVVDWNRRTAAELTSVNPGKQPVTTHFCGDYQNNLKYRKITDLPELDYIVGDAYRDPNRATFYDLMGRQGQAMAEFKKPVLITEFGVSAGGGNEPILVADIRVALWSSLFEHQAGAPLTWWHDFVHKRGFYHFYLAFARYMADIDPRGKHFEFRSDIPVVPAQAVKTWRKQWGKRTESYLLQPIPFGRRAAAWGGFNDMSGPLAWMDGLLPPECTAAAVMDWRNPGHQEYPWQACIAGAGNEAYGWVFFRPAMSFLCDADFQRQPFEGLLLPLELKLNSGDYRLTWFNTETGMPIRNENITISQHSMKIIRVYPFASDVAFKLRRILPPGPYRGALEWRSKP